jgi:trans-2,3-dihydro-3-hydroxyanthranilate isomerase
MRKFQFIQTSVFVDRRYSFSGNQLATFWNFLECAELQDDEMQGITREMNFSETTFALTPSLDNVASRVRIFTPGKEIPFAGHPTLGTAYVLKEKSLLDPESDSSALELGVGRIPVDFLTDTKVRMTQPQPEFLQKIEDPSKISKILGIEKDDISKDFPMQYVTTGFPFLIIKIENYKAVQKAYPNPLQLNEILSDFPSREILIFTTDCAHSDSSVHVRMFAPEAGVPEDPATGSAAGPLGAYLHKYEVIDNNRNEFMVEQGYEMNRPSLLEVEVPPSMEHVFVSGEVRITAEGHFMLSN